MAMPKPKTSPSKTKTSIFLVCFGYSKKVSLDRPLEAQLSGTHKKKRWFSCWPRFKLKPSATKTVPVVEHSSEKTTSHCKCNKLTKSRSKSKSNQKSKSDKSNLPSSSANQTSATNPLQLCQLPGTQPRPPPQKHGHGDADLGNAEKLDEADATNDDTCLPKSLPSRRTNEIVEMASSRTNSAAHRSFKISSVTPTAGGMISNAVSLLMPGRQAGKQTPVHSHATFKKSLSELAKSKKLEDPLVGMSITIIVILIVVVFCGRLYAIICTSAWFYFIPRLRVKENVVNGEPNSSELKNSSGQLDLDSKDYKKKVIMEGLLERNHRLHRDNKR